MSKASNLIKEARSSYPSAEQVDAWANEQFRRAQAASVCGELIEYDPITPSFGNNPCSLDARYVRFTADDGRRPFYGYWQPTINSPAPLLVNLPGYGSYISMHPQLCDLGYNVLHVSPLGYVEPDRVVEEFALPDGRWPVLPNTAAGKPGGYEDWLSDCLLAIRWGIERPEVLADRLSLCGTSQGGGGSLLLASILGPERVRCVCADLPFLTDFPRSGLEGYAYNILKDDYESMTHAGFWRRLGYVDTVSHAHRLTMPVLLTAGGQDDTCPRETVESLFEKLPGTKQYTFLEKQTHTHTRSSMFLFSSWLRMYA